LARLSRQRLENEPPLAGIEHALKQLREPAGLMQELAAGLETEEPAAEPAAASAAG
jgi:hypothetical protein